MEIIVIIALAAVILFLMIIMLKRIDILQKQVIVLNKSIDHLHDLHGKAETKSDPGQGNDRLKADNVKNNNSLQVETSKWSDAEKSKLLRMFILQVINKNKTLRSILRNLYSGKKEVKEGQGEIFDKTIRETKESIRVDIAQDWNQFRVHFDESYPGFFKKLKEKYPDLSQNELKLSALIFLNLSSKEIAQLLNISIAGINKSRQRLRKKVELTPEKDLAQFIHAVFNK